MGRRGIHRALHPVELLSEAQVERVHEAVLHVMETTGVKMEYQPALDLLKKNGCTVDDFTHLVKFPSRLVEECRSMVPPSYVAKAPRVENDLTFTYDTLYFSHTSGMQSIDLQTFEQKIPTKEEYIEAIRVLDALETIDMLGCYPYFGYAGLEPKMEIPAGVALHLKYCGKHQAVACSNDTELFTFPMARLLGQEFSATIGSSPPLTWSEKALESAFRIVEADFPLSTVDGAMMGGTGPATPVGSVVTSYAEQLALVVVIQLLHPGHRMILGHFSAPLNMKTGSPAFGEIGSSIGNAMFNQMGRYYHIPVSNGSPGYVNAKTIDYQAGYEKGIAGILSALSGVNLMLLHFGVSSEVSAHPIQAILDDDIARIIGRFVQGEVINDETLATDVIHEVGPIPGHFLSQRHTMKWFRKEQCPPVSADTLTYADWIETGKKTAFHIAQDRMETLLSGEPKTYITESQEADLEAILREAEAYYRKQDV